MEGLLSLNRRGMKIHKKILCFFVFMSMLFPIISRAESSYESRVKISFKLELEGDFFDDVFKFILSKKEETNRFLEIERLTLKGKERGDFEELIFTKPGKYEYELKQISGDRKNASYDNTVYYISIFVQNERDKSGNYTGKLVNSMFVSKNRDKGKIGEPVFRNIIYKDKKTDNPNPETGDFHFLCYVYYLILSILLLIYYKKILKSFEYWWEKLFIIY